MIYTSRYSNPELKSGKYTTVRISLGTPKWNIGFHLDAEMPDLMPFGLLGKFDTESAFRPAYFKRLDQIGTQRIYKQLQRLEDKGKDVVLLCYEDIRKGDDNWCHRRTFAAWWLERTGEVIPELYDPTPDPLEKLRCAAVKKRADTSTTTPQVEQLSLF